MASPAGVFDEVLRLLGAIGFPGLLLWWLRDRKKTNAEGEVAKRSVRAKVTEGDASALEAHVLAVEKAFRVERDSKDREIASQGREIANLRRQLREAQAMVDDLHAQVATLAGKLARLEGSAS